MSIACSGPIGVVSILLFYMSWPEPEQLLSLQRRSWREVDYVGSFLLLSAAVLVVFSFQNAGSDGEKWGQAVFLAPFILGLACWAALFAWEAVVEKRWQQDIAAAFPIRLLRNRVYAAGVLNTLFLGFGFMLTVFAFPLRLQVINQKSPLVAGLMLLPLLCSVALGSTLGGIISSKRNYLFETLFVATCLNILGFGLMTTLSDSDQLEAKALGFLTFIGFGYGMTATASTIIAVLESSIEDHGAISSSWAICTFPLTLL
jgi:hypothetical protein